MSHQTIKDVISNIARYGIFRELLKDVIITYRKHLNLLITHYKFYYKIQNFYGKESDKKQKYQINTDGFKTVKCLPPNLLLQTLKCDLFVMNKQIRFIK